MAAPTSPPLARNIVVGAVIGAVIGLLGGLLAWAIVGSGSLVVYEVVAGAAGIALGGVLGAFYGGAISLPRRGR